MPKAKHKPPFDCLCCNGNAGERWICEACLAAHPGYTVYRDCPIYAADDAARAARIAAMPPSTPVTPSVEMNRKMWSLDT